MLIHLLTLRKLRELGAEGIGLCRTEHMFFESNQELTAFREMICSDTVEEREAALDKIIPISAGRLRKALYEALEGNPVTIQIPRSAASRIRSNRRG